MKLLRTIRLDPSDGFVFERAAEPGEIAIVGSFMFWDDDPATYAGKRRAAFRSGFLGVASFGFSTLAVAQPATADEIEAAVTALADGLVRWCGAPDRATALPAAREEIAYAVGLADHPENTLVALHRTLEDDGHVRERFRTLTPGKPVSEVRAFSFVAVDGEETTPDEHVDLTALIGKRS